MKTKLEFIAAYAAAMKHDCETGKNCYVVPASWEALAEKMMHSLLKGTANTSDVCKRVVRKAGGKPTVKGVREFIESLI